MRTLVLLILCEDAVTDLPFADEIPTPDEEVLNVLRLNLVPGVGPRMQQNLLEFFGSASDIFHADLRLLEQVDGIGPKLARLISVVSVGA